MREGTAQRAEKAHHPSRMLYRDPLPCLNLPHSPKPPGHSHPRATLSPHSAHPSTHRQATWPLPLPRTLFPLLCLGDPYLSFPRVTWHPSYRALGDPQARSGATSTKVALAPLTFLPSPPAGCLPRWSLGYLGAATHPTPVSPQGQMTRSLGLALSTLSGRLVSSHTFLPSVLEKEVRG